jgi:hypothetical protein
MSQEKMKKLTLAQAVERARQSSDDKVQLFDVESDLLGLALPCRRMQVDKVLGFMDDASGDLTIKKNVDFFCQLILKHVPILQDEEFQKGHATPVLAIKALFHDNVGEIIRVGEKILGQYGMGDLDKIVKNS